MRCALSHRDLNHAERNRDMVGTVFASYHAANEQ
jgi:hypothetical protein